MRCHTLNYSTHNFFGLLGVSIHHIGESCTRLGDADGFDSQPLNHTGVNFLRTPISYILRARRL